MGSLSPMHWLLVLAVVVLLFGAKKLPDAARGLGRSMRIFKSEIQEMNKDDQPGAAPQQQLPVGGQPQAAHYVQPQSGSVAVPQPQQAAQPPAQSQPHGQPAQQQNPPAQGL